MINKIKQLPKNYLLFSLIFSLLILNGCISPRETGSENSPSNQIQSWKLKGKIAIVYPDENCKSEICTNRSDQGSIIWEQKNDNYKISISDPFGKVLYKVTGNSKNAQLDSGKQTRIIDNPDLFIKDNLKIDATITNLKSWLTGRSDPNEAKECVDNCASFTQKGFNIRHKQWRQQDIGKVPSYIKIVKGSRTLKVIVRNWEKI